MGYSYFASKPNTIHINNNQYSSPTVLGALSLQTPLVHHPPSSKSDSHHLVSLTSNTCGSLLLIEPINSKLNGKIHLINSVHSPADPCESFSPNSVINTWELIDNLNDELDFEMGESLKPNSSFSDHAIHHSLEESFMSKLDPNVVSSYRSAFSSRQLSYTKKSKGARSVGSNHSLNFLKLLILHPWCFFSFTHNNGFLSQNKKDKFVLYFTSLRGIRKTHEDCYAVRLIFRGFRFPELQSVLKEKAMNLLQVFIRGKHIGGVVEIRQLNETDPKLVCESYGDARFLPCPNCHGSRKVFDEEEEQPRICLNCNEMV
ncbi:hypothetical protein P3X46_004641 [Hevea brasiliensis]|uniref:Glutaredoxin domain-containing protein n=1 Tax=Hevea brasiliensis TaxID=3981 RepID=A0ABQ9MXD9_HEVBR|nr:hypothetical protein P3X46_004641 [Hevea brasiliensis]